MKRLLLSLLLLCAQAVQADAVSDAYNAGSSYGKTNSSQGISGMSNTSPSSVIPGYTSSPTQSGYYGGVQGGDGGIGDKGQTELGQNNAGQAIINSGTSNPAVAIDPNAPFITNGKNAESTADTVVNGTYDQCTDKIVSKSTFQNFTCDQDVNVIQACARTATMTGHYQNNTVTNVITIDSDNLDFTTGSTQYTMPAGTLISATMAYTFDKHLAFSNPNWFLNLNVFGQTFDMYDESGTYSLPVGQVFSEGQLLPLTLGNEQGSTATSVAGIWKSGKRNSMYHFVLTLTLQTGSTIWVPGVTWSESCAFDKNTATASAGSTCTDPGGNRQQVVDGQTYTVYSDCWQYTDNYVTPSNSVGNCSSLKSDPSCTSVGAACTESDSGYCTHQQVTYQCQKTYTSAGRLCGSNYFCMTGDCSDTDGAGDSGFDTAVAKLAGLASAGDDVVNDQINIKAFTGQALSCRKAMAGFSNCCVDSGWGNSAGLANCNSDEMAIGKAKAKKVVVSVGEACNRAVLGVCIQKKQVYCVFGGKLARIIQEQGRRDQLGVSFGSGDSPDCRGITIPELQNINFDLINFADFYSDLMENQKIPDSSVMVQQVKDRIAAQVNAQSGGK